MFVREKTVNGYTYLYLVENVREDGRTKQRIIRNLGRKEAVLATGVAPRKTASCWSKRSPPGSAPRRIPWCAAVFKKAFMMPSTRTQGIWEPGSGRHQPTRIRIASTMATRP